MDINQLSKDKKWVTNVSSQSFFIFRVESRDWSIFSNCMGIPNLKALDVTIASIPVLHFHWTKVSPVISNS